MKFIIAFLVLALCPLASAAPCSEHVVNGTKISFVAEDSARNKISGRIFSVSFKTINEKPLMFAFFSGGYRLIYLIKGSKALELSTHPESKAFRIEAEYIGFLDEGDEYASGYWKFLAGQPADYSPAYVRTEFSGMNFQIETGGPYGDSVVGGINLEGSTEGFFAAFPTGKLSAFLPKETSR